MFNVLKGFKGKDKANHPKPAKQQPASSQPKKSKTSKGKDKEAAKQQLASGSTHANTERPFTPPAQTGNVGHVAPSGYYYDPATAAAGHGLQYNSSEVEQAQCTQAGL